MSKQLGDDSKDELSKEALTSILSTSPANGELLKQEHVQRSMLHLVLTDQQWWTDCGKAALGNIRQFVENNPRSELAIALTSFGLKVTAELQAAIQDDDTASSLIWAEVLASVTPASSEAKVWTALLQGVAQAKYSSAYERWWKEYGRAAISKLRPLADKNPHSALATALASFARGAATELQVIVPRHDAVAISLLLDVLVTSASLSSKENVWVDLLQKLSKAIRTHAYETYTWELRSSLIQAWGSIPSLLDSPLMHSWLDVRWSELERLLSLNVPGRWYKTAITMLLSIPLDIPPREVIDVATYHAPLFEEVLQQLMRTPATQKGVIRFFATLAEHGYPRTVPLLGVMLVAGINQQEIMEALLGSAYLEPRDVVNLLEHHCQSILSEYQLPPTLLVFLRQYLSNFDVDDLDHRPARELLQRLQQRNEKPTLRLPTDLQAYVQGWCSIAQFIEQPAVSRRWLSDVSAIPQLTPDTQVKLTSLLVPRLVEFVSTEADLCRVLDNLGQVLLGQGIGTAGPGLLLLEQMVGAAGEVCGRERPPIRLIPYIKIALGEAHALPSPEKEECVHRCLPGLLAYIDTETLMMLDANTALWPLAIQAEWKTYLAARYGLSTIARTGETEQTNHASSLAADSPLQRLVATVNGQPVSFEQLRKMYYIKALYLQYESYVQQRTVGHGRMHTETQELQTATDPQRLQQAALDALVNNLLIQEGIAELVKQNSSLSLNFDPNRQLSSIFQGFQAFCGTGYVTLLSSNHLTDDDVIAALRIFIQQDLFDLYLQTQRKSLPAWLKERRKRAKIVVNIH